MLGRVWCDENSRAECPVLLFGLSAHCPSSSVTWTCSPVAPPLPRLFPFLLPVLPRDISQGPLALCLRVCFWKKLNEKAVVKPQPWEHWPFLQVQEDVQCGVSMRCLLFLAAVIKAEVCSPQKGVNSGSNRIKPCHPLPERLGRAEFQNRRNGKGQA